MDLGWVEYILFAVVFGVSSFLGIYFGCCGNRQETKNDYLLGGRSMAVTPVAVSLIASTLSSSSLLGIPTEIYLYGTQYWMMGVSVLIAAWCANYIFLPVYYNSGISTLYEYLELRFNINVRRMVSFIYVLDCLTLMPCIVYAPALALNQINGFDIHLTAIILSVGCIFYTALGGLRGVVWSSTLQFCITLCTLCAVSIIGIVNNGGFSKVWENSKLGDRIEFFNINPDPTLRGTLWSVVIGNTFIWMNYMSTNPAAIQRFLAIPTIAGARKALFSYAIGTLIAKSLCCFAGLIVFAKYYNCDPLSAGYVSRPDQIFPYYVLDIASKIPGITGLFMAAVFSTTLSALSSLINALTGTIYVDLVEGFLPMKVSEKAASNLMKIISVLLGIATVALVFVIERLGTILQLVVSFSAIVAGPQVGVSLLGMLFPLSNSKGALCGATTTIIAMTILTIGRYVNNVDATSGYSPKSFDVSGCNDSIIVDTVDQLTNNHSNESIWIFRISFYYYSLFGVLITLVVGLIVSWATKTDQHNINVDLLSPVVHHFTKKVKSSSTADSKRSDIDVNEPFLTKNSIIRNTRLQIP